MLYLKGVGKLAPLIYITIFICYNFAMENENQDFEDFISTVSHELRTPLTSIKGFSQTMLSSWNKLDDENKKKFIKIIEQQSQRLINLVENMLAVTKLHSKNIFVYNPADIKPLIEQTITIVKSKYPDKQFKFTCNPNISQIFVDKDKFVQIMTNLIENGAKYSTAGSEVVIIAEPRGDNVEIKVSNIGIGIDKKDYEKIFTKFSRIDNPLTRKVQGSGLGLFITKSLVEKMGGNISVKSQKIIGSEYSEITFTLFMPVKNIEEQTRIKCGQ